MKRVLTAILVAGIIMCSGCKKDNDKAVIMVGENAITKQEINEIVDKQLSSPFLAQIDKESNDYKIMKIVAVDKAVNELIVKKMLLDEIAKRNIVVSPEEMDKHKNMMLEQIGGEENLKKVLAANNITENDFKELIANEIQITKLINSISPVNVSDADVKKFYNDNKISKFSYPETVRASHILIKDKAKAEDVLAQAKKPKADFAALAKQYSEDPGSAEKGGDLGFFTKEQMVKPFADASFALKPDSISGLVKSEFGYHIIKVVDRKKAGVTLFNDVKNEIKKYLEDEKKVAVLQEFIEAKKAETTIEYIDEKLNPENIKKEMQALSADNLIAPQPSDIPQEVKETK